MTRSCSWREVAGILCVAAHPTLTTLLALFQCSTGSGRRETRTAPTPLASNRTQRLVQPATPAIGSAIPFMSEPGPSVLQTSLQELSSVQHSEQIAPEWNGQSATSGISNSS
jgi:hypothetical protein